MSLQSGQALVAAMKVKGLTQVEVSGAVGVTQPTVSMWCRGNTCPEAKHWATLEELLGLSPVIWVPADARAALKLSLPANDPQPALPKAS